MRIRLDQQDLINLKTFENDIGRKIPYSNDKILNLNRIEYITSYPPRNYGYITGLCLRGAKLDYIPDSIGCLKNLTVLELGYNNLRNLPESISDLSELQYLGLEYNQLSTLPMGFEKLINLREINLFKNNFLKFPDTLHHLRHTRDGVFIDPRFDQNKSL